MDQKAIFWYHCLIQIDSCIICFSLFFQLITKLVCQDTSMFISIALKIHLSCGAWQWSPWLAFTRLSVIFSPPFTLAALDLEWLSYFWQVFIPMCMDGGLVSITIMMISLTSSGIRCSFHWQNWRLPLWWYIW